PAIPQRQCRAASQLKVCRLACRSSAEIKKTSAYCNWRTPSNTRPVSARSVRSLHRRFVGQCCPGVKCRETYPLLGGGGAAPIKQCHATLKSAQRGRSDTCCRIDFDLPGRADFFEVARRR